MRCYQYATGWRSHTYVLAALFISCFFVASAWVICLLKFFRCGAYGPVRVIQIASFLRLSWVQIDIPCSESGAGDSIDVRYIFAIMLHGSMVWVEGTW